MRQPDKEQFLKDVSDHQMTVAHNDGIYRHVRFRAAEHSWNMWFDLVTWPGFLTICGDMGTWTFARVPDMFTFFRSSRDLSINPSYWAEKLQNGTNGGRDNAKVFDAEVFAERLLDQLKNYYGLEGSELETVTAAVKEEVLTREEGNGPHALIHAAAEFECQLGEEPEHSALCRRGGYRTACICGAEKRRKAFRFDPCELPDGKDYSYYFIWCLFAIVWGIQQYDSANHPASAESKG